MARAAWQGKLKLSKTKLQFLDYPFDHSHELLSNVGTVGYSYIMFPN